MMLLEMLLDTLLEVDPNPVEEVSDDDTEEEVDAIVELEDEVAVDEVLIPVDPSVDDPEDVETVELKVLMLVEMLVLVLVLKMPVELPEDEDVAVVDDEDPVPVELDRGELVVPLPEVDVDREVLVERADDRLDVVAADGSLEVVRELEVETPVELDVDIPFDDVTIVGEVSVGDEEREDATVDDVEIVPVEVENVDVRKLEVPPVDEDVELDSELLVVPVLLLEVESELKVDTLLESELELEGLLDSEVSVVEVEILRVLGPV